VLADRDFQSVPDVFESARKIDDLLAKRDAKKPKKSDGVHLVTSRGERRQENDQEKCGHCGKTNHTTDKCYICYKCEQHGHRARHCPQNRGQKSDKRKGQPGNFQPQKKLFAKRKRENDNDDLNDKIMKLTRVVEGMAKHMASAQTSTVNEVVEPETESKTESVNALSEEESLEKNFDALLEASQKSAEDEYERAIKELNDFDTRAVNTNSLYAVDEHELSYYQSKRDIVEERQDTPEDDVVWATDVSTTITVTLFGKEHRALLDTGSRFNIIEESFLRERRIPYQKNGLPSLRSANGGPMNVAGVLRLSLAIGGRSVIDDFVVVSRLSVGVILGRQFMSKNAVTIDFEDMTYSIRKWAYANGNWILSGTMEWKFT